MTRLSIIAAAVFGIVTFGISTVYAGEDSSNDKDTRVHQVADQAPDFAAIHAAMCRERFARKVGRTAYLEAKLALTQAQQPLFDNWKSAVLASANSEETTCAAETMSGKRPDILERMAREQTRLEARLAALQSEMPAFTPLYQSLTDAQKRAFDHRHGHHGDGRWGHHRMMEGQDKDHDGA